MSVSAISVTPNPGEYMIPQYVFFVNEKNEEPKGKGQQYGKSHVQHGDGAYIFQKAGSEYILKSHKVLRSAALPAAKFLLALIKAAARRVF